MIRREPQKVRILQDVYRLGCLLIIVAGMAGTWVGLPRVYPAWVDLTARSCAMFVVQLLLLAILREVIPAPLVGSHRVAKDPGYTRWIASTSFAEVATNVVLRWPFSFLHVTRFLYWRALGARIAFGASVPWDLVVRDPVLLVIEHGAQLEHGVRIEQGLHARGRIRVDSVHISGGCLIGAHAVLMPGASIGLDARVSPGAYVGPDVSIGVGTRVGERAVIAAGVDVGAHARIGAGVVISEGVRVGDHARILAGAVIPPNAIIREREVWRGIGARPVFRDERDAARAISRI